MKNVCIRRVSMISSMSFGCFYITLMLLCDLSICHLQELTSQLLPHFQYPLTFDVSPIWNMLLFILQKMCMVVLRAAEMVTLLN